MRWRDRRRRDRCEPPAEETEPRPVGPAGHRSFAEHRGPDGDGDLAPGGDAHRGDAHGGDAHGGNHAHHRHHGHRRRRHWLQLRSIHQRLVGVMLVAVLVGAGGTFAAHHAADRGWSWHGVLCVGLAVWLAVGPLAWIATVRIARPVEQLARVAGDLRQGNLARRVDLHPGDGEVGEVADALRGITDRLVAQLGSQRALMAAVSHELRSPLGRVRVLTELLREGTAPDSAYDDLQREVDGMDALVGDLLAAARIDFEAVAPRDLEVRDVALRALDLAQVPAEALVVHGEAGRVQADATLLARAVVGLLDNARRYGGQDVRLIVDDLGDRVQLTVQDDGPGFAPGDEVRAFEPFWRGPANGDGPAPKGEGLGLALVRQIAEAHGGQAGARNVEPRGARVWMVLPRGAGSGQHHEPRGGGRPADAPGSRGP